MKNLKELYQHSLKDLYSANEQSKALHQSMVDASENPKLCSALEDSVEGIQDGINCVSELMQSHDLKSNETCKGMQGLVNEAEKKLFEHDFGDATVKDAAIIEQAQRTTHYAIAGYGTAAAFATQLGLTEEAKRLNVCLDNCYQGDRRLTEIAMSKVNNQAAS